MTTYVNPPSACDACRQPISDKFYDARTRQGFWANLCFVCFGVHTDGQLGTGRGQKYVKRPNGKFEKVEG